MPSDGAFNYGTHIAAPTIILFILGLSLTASFNTVSTLLVDIYPNTAAAATASNNFVRCLLGAGATAVLVPMLDAMGIGWCFTFIAFVMMLFTIPLLLAVIRFGPKWREERRVKQEASEAEKGPRN